MSIEAAIHERWSRAVELTQLVPIDRVTTGMTKDDAIMPFVVLAQTGVGNTTRSTDELITTNLFRFEITADEGQLSEAKDVAEAIRTTFHRADFKTSIGSVLDMKPVNREETHNEDGTWTIALDYQTLFAQAEN